MKFRYEVLVAVPLSFLEIESLMRLSAVHYDGHCRSVGQLGGFLYGLHNQASLTWDQQAPPVLRFREIDTLCKILENRSNLELERRLHSYLTAINAEQARLREP